MSEFKKTLQGGTPALAGSPGPEGASGMAPPSHSFEPPPPTREELTRTRAAGPQRLGAGAPTPARADALRLDAPDWMVRARSLSAALEGAITAGRASPALLACLDRAWAAWELDGVADRHVARVASLVERARTAIRDTPAGELERAFADCAQVVWASLPRDVKERQDRADVLRLMRTLRDEADPWAAVVEATSRLLGWSEAARAHAASAIRVALDLERAG